MEQNGLSKTKLTVTNCLIMVNVSCFVAVYHLKFDVSRFILHPHAFVYLLRIWTPATYMFIHGNYLHLVLNMLFLFIIGNYCERYMGRMGVGRPAYLYLCIVSGIIGGLAFVISSYLLWSKDLGPLALRTFGSSPSAFCIGSSGIAFALGGLLMVLDPKAEFWPFFLPIPVPLYLGIPILFIVMWVVSLFDGVANVMHFGALLHGIVFGLCLRWPWKFQLKK